MPRIPSVTPRELVAALRRLGFSEVRQTGSHLIVRHPDGRFVVVPIHRSAVPAGTMRGILKAAELTIDEFNAAL